MCDHDFECCKCGERVHSAEPKRTIFTSWFCEKCDQMHCILSTEALMVLDAFGAPQSTLNVASAMHGVGATAEDAIADFFEQVEDKKKRQQPSAASVAAMLLDMLDMMPPSDGPRN